jgi:hypothetical protein
MELFEAHAEMVAHVGEGKPFVPGDWEVGVDPINGVNLPRPPTLDRIDKKPNQEPLLPSPHRVRIPLCGLQILGISHPKEITEDLQLCPGVCGQRKKAPAAPHHWGEIPPPSSLVKRCVKTDTTPKESPAEAGLGGRAYSQESGSTGVFFHAHTQ